jgi:hypothetical protein
MAWGIAAEDFLTAEGRAMFNHISGYYSQSISSGSVMGENAARQIYPTFILCDDPSMTTPALCAEVRRNRIILELKSQLQKSQELVEINPLQAAAFAQQAAVDAMNLSTGRNLDIRFTSAIDHILTRYDMRKKGIDLSVAKWPWEPLNNATGGIEHDDYVIFYGRPKSMKSWVLAYLIAWFFNNNKRVLVYTKEMSWENIFMRVAACIAEIEYQGLRMGQLTYDHEQSLFTLQRMLKVARDTEKLICLQGNEEGEGGDTVPWLRSKVDSYKPDFVCIDGLYLMSDAQKSKKDHERVRNISRDLRQMNLKTRVPVFATLQANRKAAGHEDANLDELAFSDAIGQDATNVMRVINEKTGPTIALVVGGAREFKLNGLRINAIPATDFSYHGPLSEKEIMKAKEADAKSEDEDNAEAHAKKRKAPTDGSAIKSVVSRIGKMV